MKKLFVLLVLAANTLVAQIAPSPSPGASLVQTVGTTKVTLTYSRPGVKGREVFGKLVPFGSIWRTGANSATQIETTGEISIEGQKLPAGKYSIHTIPGADEWTFIVNKNATASTEQYKQEEDAVRVKVKPSTLSSRVESFTMDISDLSDESAKLNIAWDKTAIAVNIKVDAEGAVVKAIEQQSATTAGSYQQAADFMMTKGKFTEALSFIDKSIGLKETFRNNLIKSLVLGKMGKAMEALPFAQKAIDMGGSDPIFRFFKDQAESNLLNLKSMIPPPPAPVEVPSLPSKRKKKA